MAAAAGRKTQSCYWTFATTSKASRFVLWAMRRRGRFSRRSNVFRKILKSIWRVTASPEPDMKRWALCSLVIFLCAAAGELCGQEREPVWHLINGIVVDENESPVEQAHVCAMGT